MSRSQPTQAPAPAPAPTSAPTPAPPHTPETTPSMDISRCNKNNAQQHRTRFTPKITTIESLVSNSKNRSQDFTKFQKSIYHHVLTRFENSKDLFKSILEFADPYQELKKNFPTLAAIRTSNKLAPVAPPSKESADKTFKRESESANKLEMAKILCSNQIKIMGYYHAKMFCGTPRRRAYRPRLCNQNSKF